jgi:hypothetical protein
MSQVGKAASFMDMGERKYLIIEQSLTARRGKKRALDPLGRPNYLINIITQKTTTLTLLFSN